MSGENTSKQHTTVSHLKDMAGTSSIAWDWATWMAYSENKHDEFKSDLLFIACIIYLVTDGKNKGPWMWWFSPTIVQSQAVGPFMRYLKQYNGSFPQQKPAKGEWLSDQIPALAKSLQELWLFPMARTADQFSTRIHSALPALWVPTHLSWFFYSFFQYIACLLFPDSFHLQSPRKGPGCP